jgi:hypothetical protein
VSEIVAKTIFDHPGTTGMCLSSWKIIGVRRRFNDNSVRTSRPAYLCQIAKEYESAVSNQGNSFAHLLNVGKDVGAENHRFAQSPEPAQETENVGYLLFSQQAAVAGR